MREPAKLDALLLTGSLGFVVVMCVAQTKPESLTNVKPGDLSHIGIMVNLASLLSIGGLFAFFLGMPGSLRDGTGGIYRIIYALGFVAVSAFLGW